MYIKPDFKNYQEIEFVNLLNVSEGNLINLLPATYMPVKPRQIREERLLSCEVCEMPIAKCECTLADSVRVTLLKTWERREQYGKHE